VPILTARFNNITTAEAALAALATDGVLARLEPTGADLGKREAKFMGRIVILVALWSVFGTALGAGLGVLIAVVFGPDGTDGMIIQAVSWAIFAHLLGGLWAGYWLLADRSKEEMPIPGGFVLLTVECASIDGTERAAVKLREHGAANIETKA